MVNRDYKLCVNGSNLNRFIGRRVKVYRGSIGMTQEEMGGLLGYSDRSSFKRLEDGEVEWKTTSLMVLAKETNLDFISILCDAVAPREGDPLMSEDALKETLMSHAQTIDNPLIKAAVRAIVRTMNVSFVRAFLEEIDLQTLKDLDKAENEVRNCSNAYESSFAPCSVWTSGT